MVLPPNVSQADFNAALGEFRSTVARAGFSALTKTWRYTAIPIPSTGAKRKSVWPRRRLLRPKWKRCNKSYAPPIATAYLSIRSRPGATHLRRIRAHHARQRRSGFEAHEPHFGSRRKAGV